MRPALSFRAQIVGSTVLLVAAVIIVLIGGTQAVLEATARRDIGRALDVRADAAISVLHDDGTPSTGELEPGTRVYDASGRPVAGSVEHVVSAKADELARQALAKGSAQRSDGAHDVHLLATPFAAGDGRGVVVVSQDAAPYERSERYALVATGILGLVVILLAGAVARRVTRKALEPVQQMATRAADWSEHDLSHRFALGPPTNELAALGETLDHLLDRVAAAIRGEQRLTSELAHELRTPLTAVRGAAELALMRSPEDPSVRDDLAAIADAAERMSQVVTTLLELARTPASSRTAARADMTTVVPRLVALVPAPLTLKTDVPDRIPSVTAPDDLVVRALAPLVENAARHARSQVGLRVQVVGDRIEVTVCDDGPGVDAALGDLVFQPGASGDGGTGLGLGIARRVARSLGGDVDLRDPARAEFVLSLPRA